MGCFKEADSSDYAATSKTNPPPAQNNQDSTGDPVNVVTGAFTLSEQDISFPTQRLRIELVRHYDNQRHEADLGSLPGPFGRGWTHSLNLYLKPGPLPGQVCYVDDKGCSVIFQPEMLLETALSLSSTSGMQLRSLREGGFIVSHPNGVLTEFEADGSRRELDKDLGHEKQKVAKKSASSLRAGPLPGQITYVDEQNNESIFGQSKQAEESIS